jgi:hypothetical protein
MKKTLFVLLSLSLAVAAIGAEHHPPMAPSPAFDRMKTLLGNWKATVPNFGEVDASYTLHSDGSALLETLKMPGEQSMITVYYPVGSDIAMTHYCSGHNQPHMRAAATADGQPLRFAMTSIDNLPSKDADHMDGVVFTFKDADHFRAQWSSAAAGKTSSVPFEFTRVR